MARKRLLIVDDHQLVVDGLREIFQKDGNFDVVGTANDGHEALRYLQNLPVDLVITDIDMPNMGGLELTKQIKANGHSSKVIILTMHNERSLMKEVLQIGADGFLLKTASSEEMLLAAHAVLNGNRYVSSAITDIIQADPEPKSKAEVDLSERELQILQLIAEGFTNKEIGDKVHISHRTVDKHRANMMQKIGAKNIAELVRFAMKNELID